MTNPDKQKSELVYALADYKQLVLAYQSKYAQMVKRLSFWKTSVLWLLVIFVLLVYGTLYLISDYKQRISYMRSDIRMLENKVDSNVVHIERLNQELSATKEILKQKELSLIQLEKDISTNSKKLLERMLKDQK